MQKSVFAAAAVAALSILAPLAPSSACTAFVVGKKASATGRVLVGHNEDNSGTFVRYALLPRRGDIPAIFWSEVKNPKGGDKVAHCFYSERGVFILSNNGGVMDEWDGVKFSLPDEGAASSLSEGGIGYDLRIRAIERAKSARDAVDEMASLVERYGYSQPSRNFVIADADEAWIFEAVYGRRYIARRVPDDEVVAYPNCLVFNRLKEGDIASECVRSKGADFDFTVAYQGPRTWKSPYNLHRWQEFYRIAAGVDVPVGDEYPFSVKPARKVSVEDIKNGLRSHYEGRPCERKDRHPRKSPREISPICRIVTLESLVCTFGETPDKTVIETTLGRPCETPYMAWRPFGGVLPPGIAKGAEAMRRLENRCAPMPPSRVAVFAGDGPRGRGYIEWLRLVAESPEIELSLVDGAAVRAGALDAVDAIVMPGGNAYVERNDLGPEGVAKLKAFIRAGGGYIGTCAGCFLALDDKMNRRSGTGIVPYGSSGSKGGFDVPVVLGDAGAWAMAMRPGECRVRYHGGPTIIPSTNTIDGASFDMWATYSSDFDCPKSSVRMFGKGAIVGGTYGDGRVIAIACHPEAYVATLDLVQGAFRYVLARPISFPARIRAPKSLAVGVFASVVGGVATARAILDIDGIPGADLVPLTSDEIKAGDLAHVDFLLLPDGPEDYYEKKFTGTSRDLMFAYAAAGGKVVAWGRGRGHAPPGAIAFATGAEAVAFLRGKAEGCEAASAPIGVFDSGVGGLTVLEQLLTLDRVDNATGELRPDGVPDLEGESFTQLADQANLHYGSYAASGADGCAFLRELAVRDALFLLSGGYFRNASESVPTGRKTPAKIVVVACNTATAYGLGGIESTLSSAASPVRTVGVVNAGARSALDACGGCAIGVLSTPGTDASGVYPKTIAAEAARRGVAAPPVVTRGCPDLADAIQFGRPDAPDAARRHFRALVGRFRDSGVGVKLGALVFGCTHYPFMRAAFEAALAEMRADPAFSPYIADNFAFVDPAVETAAECRAALAADGLLAKRRGASKVSVFVSVPRADGLPEGALAADGRFADAYKYSRKPGRDAVDTRFVPLSVGLVDRKGLDRLLESLPAVRRSLR